MRTLCVAACVAMAAGPLAAQVPGPAAEPSGRLVPVNGHRLWVSCAGAAGPTVVVEHGGGSDGSEWRGMVAELRRDARVCVYARAGHPRSEPGPLPRDAGREADELAALVGNAGVPRPFLLVAHSLGALNALVFAQRHSEWLSGLVVLDPPPLSWLSGGAFPTIRAGVETTVARLRQRAAELRASPDSAAPARAAFREAFASELEATFGRSAELAALVQSLGDLPVLAVAGGRPDERAYGADAEAFTRAWGEQAAVIARLSTRGEFVLVAESGHNLPAEAPERVVAAIRSLLARIPR